MSPRIPKENLGSVCGRMDLSTSSRVGNDSGRCYKLEPSRDTDSHQQQSINPVAELQVARASLVLSQFECVNKTSDKAIWLQVEYTTLVWYLQGRR